MNFPVMRCGALGNLIRTFSNTRRRRLDVVMTPVQKQSSDQSRQPEFSRAALAPGLLGAIALMAGLALLETDWFVVILFAASILALILCVYAVTARAFWWLVGLVPIAVLWNPILPLSLEGQGWQFLQLAGALVFIAAGFKIKVPVNSETSGSATPRN